MLCCPVRESMLLEVAFREQLTVLLALVRTTTWVSSLQESCNAKNLYPGREKLALTPHGQERNNLPSHGAGTWEGS